MDIRIPDPKLFTLLNTERHGFRIKHLWNRTLIGFLMMFITHLRVILGIFIILLLKKKKGLRQLTTLSRN